MKCRDCKIKMKFIGKYIRIGWGGRRIYCWKCPKCGRMKTKLERIKVVLEKAKGNFSAYCDNLPGVIATAKTSRGVKKRIHEAIKLHLKKMVKRVSYE